jgi:REP element-mobilizing transposase RayT
MGRFTRVVAVDVPHHVTQRGNGRRFVLDGDADRTIYLNLLRENIVLYGVALIGYCLMSNHIHLIAIPHKVDGLPQALKHTHGRYASYWNAAHQSNGHVWQGRYYSCPLDQSHLWAICGTAICGTGRDNPQSLSRRPTLSSAFLCPVGEQLNLLQQVSCHRISPSCHRISPNLGGLDTDGTRRPWLTW